MHIRKVALSICLITVLFAVACTSGGRQSGPPELVTPLSNRVDTAIVTRGTVERVNQYRGIVRVVSDHLDFGNTTLRFDRFEVIVGDQVEEGQVIARLDVRHLEEMIERIELDISNARRRFSLENDLIRNDIYILEVELNQLNETRLINAKQIEIERKQLELRGARERQALVIRNLEVGIENVKTQIEAAKLLAPYDGVITWLAPVSSGDVLLPFQLIACISNGENIFIEYASAEHLRMQTGPMTRFVAIIGDITYEITHREPEPGSASFYFINNMTPPVRFDFVNRAVNVSPGESVIIRHYENVSHDTLIVPVNAVYLVVGYSYVYINNNGNKEMRIVEVGIRNSAFFEIRSGLEEGDEVFVR